MNFDTILITTTLSVFAISLVWGSFVYLVALINQYPTQPPSETREYLLLGFLLAPVAIAFMLLLVGSFTPTPRLVFPTFENIVGPSQMEIVASVVEGRQPVDWPKKLAWGSIFFYLSGVAVVSFRVFRLTYRYQQISNRSVETGLSTNVFISKESVPPFVSLDGKIILPGSIFGILDSDQISMIIQHEQAHLKRNDTKSFLLLSALDAVFWFNPFLKTQTNRCRLAAEVACDQAVVHEKSEKRELYARTLVAVLKSIKGEYSERLPTVSFFRAQKEYSVRLNRILNLTDAKPRTRLRYAFAVLSIFILPLGIVQYTIAHSPSYRSPNFVYTPVQNGVVVKNAPNGTDLTTAQDEFVRGLLLQVPKGEPIIAPADGSVTLIMPHPEGYGTFIMINHGGGYTSCYGPLKNVAFEAGQRFKAGDTLGTFGASDKKPFPYLFLELLKGPDPVDPIPFLKLQSI